MSLTELGGSMAARRQRSASRESLLAEMFDSHGSQDSDGQIDGLFPEKRRLGLQHFAFIGGSTELLDSIDQLLLPDQIEDYNRKAEDPEYRLQLSGDEVYSGLLRFHYQSGHELLAEDIHVRSSTTTAELIPQLLHRFLPHLPPQEDTGTTFIALVQGEMERELDFDEKPLEIALDCSIRGLAAPKFVLKTPPPLALQQPHHTSSYLSSLSNTDGGEMSQEQESPHHSHKSPTDMDGLSVNSIGSVHSSSSSKSSKSLLHRSTNSLPAKARISLGHTFSNHETGSNPGISSRHNTSTFTPTSPATPRKLSLSRPKSVMSHFIARSLRLRKKSKNSQDAEEELEHSEDQDGGVEVSSLVSPVPSERRFIMSTVMHIYFTDARKTQVYKSVLVSEKATAREVIKLALERYNMKFCNPAHFGLYEVIGQWQDVTQVVRRRRVSEMTASSSATAPPSSWSPLVHRRPPTAVEEFITLYAREFRRNESPYSAQFYLMVQEGYSRRFELRRKTEEDGVKGDLADDVRIVPPKRSSEQFLGLGFPSENNLCIFGDTAHRKRRSGGRRTRLNQQSLDSADPTADIVLHEGVSILPEGDGGPDGANLESEEGAESGNSNRVRMIREHLDGPQEIPIAVNPTHPPDFPTLTCNSPDSGVAFKDSTKSSVSSEQSDSSAIAGAHPAAIGAAFLLSLKLQNPQKELLMQKLQAERTCLVLANSEQQSTPERLYLHMADLDCHASSEPLCCIHRRDRSSSNKAGSSQSLDTEQSPSYEYSIQVTDNSIPVFLNGEEIDLTAVLQHGDLLAIGSTHLFMFQDYSSISKEGTPELKWTALPIQKTLASEAASLPSLEITNGQTKPQQVHDTAREQVGRAPHHIVGTDSAEEMEQADSLCDSRDSSPIDMGMGSTLRIRQTSPSRQSGLSSSLSNLPIIITDGSVSLDAEEIMVPEHKSSNDHDATDHEVFESEMQPQVTIHRPAQKPQSLRKQYSSLSGLPRDRKLMFSFSATEEDTLLDYIITRQDPVHARCKLAPAYILSMCVEYTIKCNGPIAAAKFTQKAADCIQDIIWDYTRKLVEWQPVPSQAQQPLSLWDEFFSLLTPVCFWLANALEFYHFVYESSDFLDFSFTVDGNSSPSSEEAEEDPITILHGAMVYAFQQAFYLIIKILDHSVPMVMESCTEVRLLQAKKERNIVIAQAVEFLQALLDLLTEYHLHLGVISQLYANIFFFINTTMFNSLLDQGSRLGLFQQASGTALRGNLNLLEGWACQVGFKDAVLHYLAKISSAIDLLATPSEELMQMDWRSLCVEYPVLHPSQLHFILSQYLLPSSMDLLPSQWTPSEKDALVALNTNAIHENFNNNPGFKVPVNGFTIDLSQPPAEAEEFQATVDLLRKTLKKPKRSVDVVPVVENHPCVSIPTVITEDSSHEMPSSFSRMKEENHRSIPAIARSWERLSDSVTPTNTQDIGSSTESQEDLLEENRKKRSWRGREIDQYEKESLTPVIVNGHDSCNKPRQILTVVEGTGKDRVERVRSLIAAESCATPEKLVLDSEDDPQSQYDEWMSKHFPPGSRTVTLQREDKGFGFTIMEVKDPPKAGDGTIFVQTVLPGSQAEEKNEVIAGDQILAIDGQLLHGASYLIAEKYLKAAEEDVSLIIAPRTAFLSSH